MPGPGTEKQLSDAWIGEKELATIFPEEECWYEAILTLFRQEDTSIEARQKKESGVGEGGCGNIPVPNASAVGIRRKADTLFFELYEGSNSFLAISGNPLVGINIPFGPGRMEVFIRCALSGYGTSEREYGESEFEIIDTGGERVALLSNCSPRLMAAVVGVREIEKEDDLGIVRIKRVTVRIAKIGYEEKEQDERKKGEHAERGWGEQQQEEQQDQRKKGEHGKREWRVGRNGRDLWRGGIPYSRAEGHLMEALIHATRFRSSGKNRLKETMEEHLRFAEKIGGKETLERAKRIRDMIYSSSNIE